MKYRRLVAVFLGGGALLLSAACSAAARNPEPGVPVPAASTMPTMTLSSQAGTPPQDRATPSVDPQIKPGIKTAEPVGATPCPPGFCPVSGHFLFARPIAPPGRDWVDPTYRYGSTQNDTREPHTGVEFVNSTGTPVIAAAAGEVIVAGDDSQTSYARWPYFYGNLVILSHDFPGEPGPLFSLYAHLSEVSVQVGQVVEQGQEIGRVGLSGVATGSHLHFEIRSGENAHNRTQNPELWLAPRLDPSGQAYGAIAGRIEDATGQVVYVPNVVVEYLTEQGGDVRWQMYLETYAGVDFAGDDLWGENFAVGDLPAGWYRITFVTRGLQDREVQVLPGQVTVVKFDVDA